MPGGRPKRKDLPEGIGLYPDYVVSVIAQENGEADLYAGRPLPPRS